MYLQHIPSNISKQKKEPRRLQFAPGSERIATMINAIICHDNLSIQDYDLLSTGKDYRSYNGTIASKIGLYEAIILNQINYWVKVNKDKENNERYYHNKMFWMYMTLDGWHEQFDYISKKTIQRALKKLKDNNLIYVGNFNPKSFDRTMWYCVNYDTVRSILYPKQESSKNRTESHMDSQSISYGLSDQIHLDSRTSPIPKNNNKEYHTKNNNKEWSGFDKSKHRSPDSGLKIRLHNLYGRYDSEISKLEDVIRYFFDKYEKLKGEQHEYIVSNDHFYKPTRLIGKASFKLEYYDMTDIVDQYFSDFPRTVWDYRHFGTENILRTRMLEQKYGQAVVDDIFEEEPSFTRTIADVVRELGF